MRTIPCYCVWTARFNIETHNIGGQSTEHKTKCRMAEESWFSVVDLADNAGDGSDIN